MLVVVCVCIVGCETPSKSTPTGFPHYDSCLNGAVQNRWHGLLKSGDYSAEGAGKVVVRFKLHSDGHVSDLSTLEATVSPTLVNPCEKAILDSAPYGKWPREMRLALGADERQITFTFYYTDTQPRPRTIREALELRHAPTNEE